MLLLHHLNWARAPPQNRAERRHTSTPNKIMVTEVFSVNDEGARVLYVRNDTASDGILSRAKSM